MAQPNTSQELCDLNRSFLRAVFASKCKSTHKEAAGMFSYELEEVICVIKNSLKDVVFRAFDVKPTSVSDVVLFRFDLSLVI